MSLFAVIAALLTLAALGVLVWPLLRRQPDQPASWLPASALFLMAVVAAVGLYPRWSNWDWSDAGPAADSPAAMVGRLARRLEKQPDDQQGWMLLGRSYAVVEQYSLAARAYERASKLADGRDAEALMGLADALINDGRGEFSGTAGRLFEKAYELEPNSVKALFYSAIAALERNELPLARERFNRMLAANPPPEVRRVIEEQLRAVDSMALMAGASGAAAAVAPATPNPVAAAEVVKVVLRITLSPGVAGKANAGAPLFVSARLPGQRMPLAAKRLDAKFPQEVELLSTDSPMGNGFAVGQDIEIEARVGNGGSAISRSGDPFGAVRLKVAAGSRASIEINQLKP